MRHLAVRLFWVQQYIKRGLMRLVTIDAGKNPADLFTKGVNGGGLGTLIKLIGLEVKSILAQALWLQFWLKF